MNTQGIVCFLFLFIKRPTKSKNGDIQHKFPIIDGMWQKASCASSARGLYKLIYESQINDDKSPKNQKAKISSNNPNSTQTM